MTPFRKTLFSAFCLLAAGGPALAESETSLLATVAELGRINGIALACGHTDVVARAKGMLIARVAKTRSLGEAFETATDQSFRRQNESGGACPARAALAVELETAALPFAVPAAHRKSEEGDAPEVGINPRYLLQAANGRAIMDGDFPDRFQLISFGYTSCPDICPTTLVEMADILKRLDDKAAKVQPIFISVDPERDTLAVLRTYTAFFDARIIGATGSPELVRHAADNFKVRYEKVAEAGAAPGQYAVDHSAGMYLLAPGGQFLARFPYGTPSADIAQRLASEIGLRASNEAAQEAAEK